MILVIEPDTMWQRSLEDTLKSIIDVTVVSSGREAVRLAPSLGQVAVVMELRLPDMHWKDLYLELLGRASYTFAVTHEDEFDTVSELLNRGFSGYFYKPTLNFSEFQRSVENLIP
jgi:DNA-binding response OmpR family regulator